jgi:hypothetical protein
MHKYGMVLALAIFGCGDGSGGTNGGNTTSGTTGNTTSGTTGNTTSGTTGRMVSYNCCINGSYYDCPSQAALDKCIPPNFTGTPDPSSCTRNSSKDGTCGSSTNGGTTGNTNGGTTGGPQGCSGATSWGPCVIDSDCNGSLLHCTSGQCYSNIFGSPCTIDSDCGTNSHCTSGCCYTDMRGNPCTIDSDCGIASSCVNGTCN